MAKQSGGSTTCPSCGKQTQGNFCSWCGGALGGRHCNQCGAKVDAGARFCNGCGATVAGGAPAGASASGSPNVGWWILGAALLIAIALVTYPTVSGQGGGVQSPTAAPGGVATGIDLTAMTPRDAADQLFNRVMGTLEAGDTAEAAGFLPMAISAYEMIEPLDADGHFHLALLKLAAQDPEGALATATEVLAESPNHLLNLTAAARAAVAMGDTGAARERYENLLAVWDVEMARGLPEYGMHESMLPSLRAEAEAFLGGG